MSDDNLFAQLDSGMSMEELGSSLLDRKAQQQKAQRKADKKAQRVTNILAGLTAGQAVFKNALNRRMKELDEQQTFLLSNNAQQVKDINNLSRIIRYLPEESWFEGKENMGEAELAELYAKEYGGGFSGMKERFRPAVDEILKQSFADEAGFAKFKAGSQYNAALESGINTLLQDYLSVAANGKRKYMNFESDLRELLNAGDLDKIDLYKRGIGMTVTDLDEAEKRMINTYRQEYRDKGFIGGFKDSLRRIGILQEEKGGMNLFKNIDQVIMDDDYLMNKSIQDMQLGGHLIGDLDQYMSNYHTSNFKYEDAATSNMDFLARIDIDMDQLYDASQMFNTKRNPEDIEGEGEGRYDKLHILRVAGDDDFMQQYFKDIKKNKESEVYEEFRADVGSLSMLFADDPEMAVRAYKDSLTTKIEGGGWSFFDGAADVNPFEEVSEEKIQEFREAMNNESFRNKFAAALLIRHGAMDGGSRWFGPAGGAETYNYDTEGLIIDMYADKEPESYRESTTHRAVKVGTGVGINFKDGKYSITDDYARYTLNEQREVFDNHMYGIFHQPDADEATRLFHMNLLFSQPFNPYQGVYDDLNDYMQDLSSMFRTGKK